MTALMVLASTAIGTPKYGPNSRPAASVKTVRGNGKTVITMCAARKASGNHGPTDVAQSRSCTAVGSGTRTATATRITIAVRIVANRRLGTVFSVARTAARTVRSVLTTEFTFTNSTGPGRAPPAIDVDSHLTGPRWPGFDHLA